MLLTSIGRSVLGKAVPSVFASAFNSTVKPNSLAIPPSTLHHSFFENLPLSCILYFACRPSKIKTVTSMMLAIKISMKCRLI